MSDPDWMNCPGLLCAGPTDWLGSGPGTTGLVRHKMGCARRNTGPCDPSGKYLAVHECPRLQMAPRPATPNGPQGTSSPGDNSTQGAPREYAFSAGILSCGSSQLGVASAAHISYDWPSHLPNAGLDQKWPVRKTTRPARIRSTKAVHHQTPRSEYSRVM